LIIEGDESKRELIIKKKRERERERTMRDRESVGRKLDRNNSVSNNSSSSNWYYYSY